MSCALLIPLSMIPEVPGQAAGVSRIEWIDLPQSIVETSPDMRTGYLVVPGRRFPTKSARTIKLPFIVGFAWGARLAVWCNEEFPFELLERILKPAGLPAEMARFVQAAVPLEALQVWPQGKPRAGENAPVRSKVPTLIAAGEFDPDTPVNWSRATAARLTDSQLVVFAGMSHVPLFTHPEANRIIREFLSDPNRKVNPGRTADRRPFALPR